MQVVIPEDRLAFLDGDEEEDNQAPSLAAEGETLEAAEPPAEQEDAAPDPKDPVPYSRFSEVIAAKNAAKAEADALKQEIAALKAGSREELDEDREPVDYSVEARIERIELAAATKVLDAEVTAAISAYPGVPESVLYKAVAEDPTSDVAVVARSYTDYVSSIEQKAVEKYLAANPGQARAPNVPPSLKTSSSAGRVTAKPKTLEQAHAAMRASLKTAEW